MMKVKDAKNNKSFMIRGYSNVRRRHPSDGSKYAKAT